MKWGCAKSMGPSTGSDPKNLVCGPQKINMGPKMQGHLLKVVREYGLRSDLARTSFGFGLDLIGLRLELNRNWVGIESDWPRISSGLPSDLIRSYV